MTADKQIDELLPCPMCAGAAVLTSGYTTNEGAWPHGTFYRVYCGSCQLRQLFHRTGKAAVAAWNCRATTAPAVEKEPTLRQFRWISPAGETSDWQDTGTHEIAHLNNYPPSRGGRYEFRDLYAHPPAQTADVPIQITPFNAEDYLGDPEVRAAYEQECQDTMAEGIKYWKEKYESLVAQTADVRAMTMQRHADMYQWLRRRAFMIDASDDGVIVLTLMRNEGPTGEFLDDQIAALSKSTGDKLP